MGNFSPFLTFFNLSNLHQNSHIEHPVSGSNRGIIMRGSCGRFKSCTQRWYTVTSSPDISSAKLRSPKITLAWTRAPYPGKTHVLLQLQFFKKTWPSNVQSYYHNFEFIMPLRGLRVRKYYIILYFHRLSRVMVVTVREERRDGGVRFAAIAGRRRVLHCRVVARAIVVRECRARCGEKSDEPANERSSERSSAPPTQSGFCCVAGFDDPAAAAAATFGRRRNRPRTESSAAVAARCTRAFLREFVDPGRPPHAQPAYARTHPRARSPTHR